MITVTDEAKAHLKGIEDDNNKHPKLGVKGGGCAGFSYDWQLVERDEIEDSDHVIDLGNGAKVIIDGTSLMYLMGTRLELQKNVFGTTLEIVNPAAASACGCGESVNFDMDKIEANMDSNLDLGFKLP